MNGIFTGGCVIGDAKSRCVTCLQPSLEDECRFRVNIFSLPRLVSPPTPPFLQDIVELSWKEVQENCSQVIDAVGRAQRCDLRGCSVSPRCERVIFQKAGGRKSAGREHQQVGSSAIDARTSATRHLCYHLDPEEVFGSYVTLARWAPLGDSSRNPDAYFAFSTLYFQAFGDVIFFSYVFLFFFISGLVCLSACAVCIDRLLGFRARLT